MGAFEAPGGVESVTVAHQACGAVLVCERPSGWLGAWQAHAVVVPRSGAAWSAYPITLTACSAGAAWTIWGSFAWRKFPASYSGGYSPDHGPRCVPLIHQGSVYLFGAAGDLHALDLKSGDVRWSRGVGREYAPPESFFGVGSTPIVEGEKLIVLS